MGLWEFGVMREFLDGVAYLLSLALSVQVVIEVGTVGVGVVLEILKRQSHLPSLFAGVAIAGGLLYPL